MIFSESDFLVQRCAANWHRRVYICSICNYHSAMDIGGPPASFVDRLNLFECVVSIVCRQEKLRQFCVLHSVVHGQGQYRKSFQIIPQ